MPIDYSKRQSAPPAPAAASGKVTLTKAAPTVSLTKHGADAGMLRVNLNWNAQPPSQSGGFFKRQASSGAIDLDLGCLYEFSDGSKGVVQALGNAFRSRNAFASEPVIWLDGDDRSGANTGGENLFVNLAYSEQIRRVLVFALIYEGAPNWLQAQGVATLFPAAGPQIEVVLDDGDTRSRICAIAQLTGGPAGVDVRREVRYIQGTQSALDREFDWGMQWQAGKK